MQLLQEVQASPETSEVHVALPVQGLGEEDKPELVRHLEAFTTISENALLWIVQQLNLKGIYALNQNPFKCVVGQSGSFDISVSSEESRGTGVV